ncbi:unnamed protein product, partial [Linum tenue]
GVGPNPGDPEDVEAFLASLNTRRPPSWPWVARELIRLQAARCITALLEHQISRIRRLKDNNDDDDDDNDAARHRFHGLLSLFWDHTRDFPAGSAPRVTECALDVAVSLGGPDEWRSQKRKLEPKRSGSADDADEERSLSDLILGLPQWISENFKWVNTVNMLSRLLPGSPIRRKVLQYGEDGDALKLLWVLLAGDERPPLVLFNRRFFRCRRYFHWKRCLREVLVGRLAFFTADLQCRRAR